MARVSGSSPQAARKLTAQVLYREVARLATSLYNTCVVTCTRASGNLYPRQRINGSYRFPRK